jgi:hypothetical protein
LNITGEDGVSISGHLSLTLHGRTEMVHLANVAVAGDLRFNTSSSSRPMVAFNYFTNVAVGGELRVEQGNTCTGDASVGGVLLAGVAVGGGAFVNASCMVNVASSVFRGGPSRARGATLIAHGQQVTCDSSRFLSLAHVEISGAAQLANTSFHDAGLVTFNDRARLAPSGWPAVAGTGCSVRGRSALRALGYLQVVGAVFEGVVAERAPLEAPACDIYGLDLDRTTFANCSGSVSGAVALSLAQEHAATRAATITGSAFRFNRATGSGGDLHPALGAAIAVTRGGGDLRNALSLDGSCTFTCNTLGGEPSSPVGPATVGGDSPGFAPLGAPAQVRECPTPKCTAPGQGTFMNVFPCQQCLPGTRSPASGAGHDEQCVGVHDCGCTACAAGTYSAAGAAACLPCPAGEFAGQPESAKCKPCFFAGWVPNAGRTDCIPGLPPPGGAVFPLGTIITGGVALSAALFVVLACRRKRTATEEHDDYADVGLGTVLLNSDSDSDSDSDGG